MDSFLGTPSEQTRRYLPGWTLRRWSFALAPGWESLEPRSMAEIAAAQWTTVNDRILDDLESLPYADKWRTHEAEVRGVLSMTERVVDRIHAWD